ncbi:hypothetical protein KKC91_05220, partial [bacterium]|nr:hypothetical protein [bacterium]
MDDKKTVFIIGAGAHVLYGLPSGYQLRQMICNENLLSEKNLQILREVIISAPEYNSPIHTRNEIDKSLNKQITQFVNNFRYSMMPYIDTFLAVHKDEMSQKIGKAIIAFIFSNLEDRKNFYVGKKINNPYLPRENNKVGEQVDDDWYHIFFRKLSAIKKGGKPPVIITFNYDRYMDYALFNYYRYTTPSMVEEEVMQHYDQHELNKLVHHKMQNESKLYHVYGKVGKLEWEEEKGTSVGFGGARSGDMYKNICENLYIVQDERLNLQVVDAPIKKLTGNLTPEERRLLNQQTNIFNIQKAISE